MDPGEWQWINMSLTRWWLQLHLLYHTRYYSSKLILSLVAWHLLADAFFSIPVKGLPEAVCYQQTRWAIHCTALPQAYMNSLALCYNLVCRILITSSFNKIITLFHYTDGTMLTVPSEQKVATTLDLLIRLVSEGREINPTKIQRSSTSVKALGS